MTQKEQQQHQKQLDHIEELPFDRNYEDEIRDLKADQERNGGFYDKCYDMAETFSTTHFGQYVIERIDRLLRMIEDTAKWSLPQAEVDEKLKRPFGWLPFIMLIILLRFLRIGVSICALLIGNSPVSAYDMVYFLQTRRRKLRAIRVHGLKEMQRLEEEAEAKNFAGSGCFTKRISALLSIAICRPGQHRQPRRRVFVRRECNPDWDDEQQQQLQQHNSKRAREEEDDSADQNLTFDQLLSKYVDRDSDDDSDFLPPAEDDESSDVSEESELSGSSSDDGNNDNSNNSQESAKKVAQNDKQLLEKPNLTVKNKSPKTTKRTSSKLTLDRSVELSKNCIHHAMPLPKPITEIKQEVTSDNDSGNDKQQQQQQQKICIPASNGNGEQHEIEDPKPKNSPAKLKEDLNLNNDVEQKKSTPGHESAAMTKPKLIPSLGSTANAGSPPAFDVIMKASKTNTNESHEPDLATLPNEDTTKSPPTDGKSQNTATHHKRPVQQHVNKHRNRGRNRR